MHKVEGDRHLCMNVFSIIVQSIRRIIHPVQIFRQQVFNTKSYSLLENFIVSTWDED